MKLPITILGVSIALSLIHSILGNDAVMIAALSAIIACLLELTEDKEAK